MTGTAQAIHRVDDDSPLFCALSGLASALDLLATVEPVRCAEPDLLEGLRRLEELAHRLDAARLVLVREVDTRSAAVSAGAASTAEWLRAVLRTRPGGRLGTSAAGCRARRGLPCHCCSAGERIDQRRSRRGHRAGGQGPARGSAGRHSPGGRGVPARAGRAVHPHRAGPAGPAPAPRPRPGRRRPAGARSESSDPERNEFSIVEQFNGRVRVVGDLDAESGAALRTALDPLAAPRPEGLHGPDTRPARRRLADAFVELVRGVLDGGGLPTSGGERPHLTVTVDLVTLERRLGARGGECSWGAALSAEAVRRLACDAKVLPMLLSGAGQPLDVGRAAYAVPPALRRALEARDRGCAFPGCGRPPAWCHAHHCKHWADGGETCLRNLVLLCAHHHRVVHHQGWKVHIGPNGLPVFLPPRWIDPRELPIRRPWRAQLEVFGTRSHDPPGRMSA